MPAKVAVHFAPHPDDELIGAPAALFALRDLDFDVVNVPLSYGRPEDATRRAAELAEAVARAGFRLRPPTKPLDLSANGLDDAVAEILREEDPVLVVSPTPHDRHPTHELVGRAVKRAVGRSTSPPRWWMWALWGPLELPTLGVRYDARRLAQILQALEAHAGELERNDFRRLVEGRGAANAVLAPELLDGFASTGSAGYAELLTEVAYVAGSWLLGAPRWLRSEDILVPPTATDVSEWLDEPSVADRFALHAARNVS